MIFKLAFRYSFSKTKNHRNRTVRSCILMTLSVVLFVLIMSIMNSLQSSRFDTVRKVRSFDCVVIGDYKGDLMSLFPNYKIFEFKEGEVLIGEDATLVRYIDQDYLGGINILIGSENGLLVPFSQYRKYNFDEEVNLTLLKQGRSGLVLPQSKKYPIKGVFYTALGDEFDSNMIFLPIAESDDTLETKTAIIGIEKSDIKTLRNLGYDLITWKESETSLYSALVLEKVMMYIVLSLLFIVLSVSTKQSISILWESKKKERTELEVLGIRKNITTFAFILSFLIVTIMSLLFSLIISFPLLPCIQEITHSNSFLSLNLHFPWGGFTFASFFLVTTVLIFSVIESSKKEDILEALYVN